MVLGFWLIHLSFKANTFASATIETAANQTVISTGAYSIVRHPMYSGASVMFLGVPLALGSLWGLAPALLMLPTLVWRLTEEEAYLARNLFCYGVYQRKVRWRLMPLIW